MSSTACRPTWRWSIYWSIPLLPPTEKGTKAVPLRKLAAFVVRTDKPIEWIDLGPGEPIATAIESWRRRPCRWYADGRASQCRRVKATGWEKLQPKLAGAKTVLLSPDGVTAQFPWPASPGRQPGTYLIEDMGIAIVPIPRLLPEILAGEKTPAATDNKETNNPSLLLLGDVDFDSRPGKATAQLLADAAPQHERSGAAGIGRPCPRRAPRWPPSPTRSRSSIPEPG